MTKKSTTNKINISLLLLVIMSGVVAVCLRDRLPTHSSADSNIHDSISATQPKATDVQTMIAPDSGLNIAKENELVSDVNTASDNKPHDSAISLSFPDANIREMQSSSHPFAKEAKKILSGNLQLSDSISRRKILNYCEHFRTAYNTKDIDFIRQVLSDDALIIVGHTVRTSKEKNGVATSNTVKYNVRSKREYLKNLSSVFVANKKISVDFSDFRIMRHPTMDGIYGVTLRQKYESDLYSDDGFIFLLWDFRNPSMPMIHVRTWQPAESLADEDDVIGIGDFDLE
ncbi:MAG: hypothetical protein NC095_10725 [Muribaculum sp.]|nr:hypothetical protein [Muribaculum sp.]